MNFSIIKPICFVAALFFVGVADKAVKSQDLEAFSVLQGNHIKIVTDLEKTAELQELPRVFDLAVPQWCDFFSVRPGDYQDWKLTCYLMQNPDRFRSVGMLPDNLPPFNNGYQRGKEIWCMAQPSPYYMRHLMLHEGTHAFMFAALGGAGATWYQEGVAELLGTHRWESNQLTLGIYPKTKQEVPFWGRIQLIKNEVKNGRAKTIAEVFKLGPQSFYSDNNSYAWSWALASFCDRHPKFQSRFRDMRRFAHLDSAEFSKRFASKFKRDTKRLFTLWNIYLTNIDYGYDIAEERVSYVSNRKTLKSKEKVTVASNRGWQSSGLILEKGKSYKISGQGRFVIRETERKWHCESGGITIEYHQGKPLGALLLAIHPAKDTSDSLTFANPFFTGMQTEIAPQRSGLLFFRINEQAGQLGDNRGSLQVTVTPTE